MDFCVGKAGVVCADNKGIVSRVASMVCRMSILRLWRAAVLNLRIACVAVSNLGIWGPS